MVGLVGPAAGIPPRSGRRPPWRGSPPPSRVRGAHGCDCHATNRASRPHRGPGNTFPRRALARAVLSAGGAVPVSGCCEDRGSAGRRGRSGWCSGLFCAAGAGGRLLCSGFGCVAVRMSSGCWVPCCAKAAETCSRSDESRRSWVLVACCLRVRAPAPVLAWVPLRSMGPVGPGRWSARHRSSPERSAMTRGPGSLVCAPRAAGLRTARCWSARCWPVQPGAEAALDAAVHWSVPVEPVAAHPRAVRAHRRRAAGLRAAGRWSPGCRGACPVSSPCATGFSRSYVKPRGRT